MRSGFRTVCKGPLAAIVPEEHSLSRRGFLEASFGLGLAALAPELTGCASSCPDSKFAWNNALRTGGVDPKRIARPKTLQEIVALVRAAEWERVGIRMTGSGHSFSDVALSKGYLLTPENLRAPLVLARDQLHPGPHADRYLVRVESGVRLRELNPWLWAQGMALSNMGGYDIQTIVGAASTGTHGSGIEHGPIASQIAALELVTKGGQVLRIEPRDGITDPAKFPGHIATAGGNVPATLEQDDTLFNAAIVAMGSLGVVYAVVLRVVPRYWLFEVREITTWGSLIAPGGFLQRLLNGVRPLVPKPEPARKRLAPSVTGDPEYYEIYFNPYPTKPNDPHSKHRCLLTKRYKLNALPQSRKRTDDVRGKLGANALHAATIFTGKGAAIADLLSNFPGTAPAVIDGSLNAISDQSYVDRSYAVFNLGAPNLVRAHGIEMAFDVAQTEAAVVRLFERAAELKEDDIVHATPPSLRFVKRSSALLAPQYGRDTMMLEMGMVVCQNGSVDLLSGYEELFHEEFQARPHWGLDFGLLDDFDQVRELYGPAADAWLEVYREQNEYGTFDGPFTDRLKISRHPPPKPDPRRVRLR